VQTSYHICRVQCALPAQPVDTVQLNDAAASCFNNAPTAIQIFEHTQARDMASGCGDQSSSSQLFPLFGKLRFPQKTKDKFQKASQGPIGRSVACLKRSSLLCAVDGGSQHSVDSCRECAESYQCTSFTCEFTNPAFPTPHDNSHMDFQIAPWINSPHGKSMIRTGIPYHPARKSRLSYPFLLRMSNPER